MALALTTTRPSRLKRWTHRTLPSISRHGTAAEAIGTDGCGPRRRGGSRSRARAAASLPSPLSNAARAHAERQQRTLVVSRALPPFEAASIVRQLAALADVAPGASADAVQAAAQAAAPAKGSGPFDFLAKSFEAALTAIDKGLEAVHVPYSYGFAIILLTVLVKLATFPLTQKQVESTLKMQAVAPSIKSLQAKYPNDQEKIQLETARLYRESGVNPLAGCLPTLATIPVFIGLYRALTLASQDGLLTEGFFFVPSLGGPATVEQQLHNQGLQWIWPFVDGVPPLGWATTAKYLALPVLLVLSQYASLAISQPATEDPAQKQTQAILKFIPVMLGWFSLNVPAGLCIYWLTNNVLTTAQQAYLKKTVKVDTPAAVASMPGAQTSVQRGATPGVIDVSDSSSDTRRSQRGEKFRARQSQQVEGAASSAVAKNARGKTKGAKFAARKAKKAAPSSSSESAHAAGSEPVPVQASAPTNNSSSGAEGAPTRDGPSGDNGRASGGDAASNGRA